MGLFERKNYCFLKDFFPVDEPFVRGGRADMGGGRQDTGGEREDTGGGREDKNHPKRHLTCGKTFGGGRKDFSFRGERKDIWGWKKRRVPQLG